MRALVLEDSRPASVLALAVLRAEGYQVERQGSVMGAKGACAGARFGLYVVDVGVPATERGGDASGLGFVAWLRATQPGAKVILWSADDHAAAARALGAAWVRKAGNVPVALVEAVRAARGPS